MAAELPSMSPMEGKSLVRGATVLLALSLVRVGLDHRRSGEEILSDAPDRLEALRHESQELHESQALRSRPLGEGETLDPNRSPEEELDRLPGVGPATARALVEDRLEAGGFRRPEDLLRVTGIGPATLKKIRPFLDFSQGIPLDLRAMSGAAPGAGSESPPAGRHLTSPEVSPAQGREGRAGVIDVNRASAAELQTLPGIGPALAGRILAFRAREGPFRTPDDLLKVSGIGPATLERIRDRVTTGR